MKTASAFGRLLSYLGTGVRRLATFAGLPARLFTVAALSLATSVANADVFIGLQQDAGPIVTVAANGSGIGVFVGAFGDFEQVTVVGLGDPITLAPLLLQTVASLQNLAGDADAGSLTIFVSSTDNTAPLGSLEFTSLFNTTALTQGWTETLQTFIDAGNGIYARTTQLGSAFFTSVGSETDSALTNTGSGPYSVTAVLSITAPSLGGASSSITVNAAPPAAVLEPATLALLALGLAGMGFARRRKEVAPF